MTAVATSARLLPTPMARDGDRRGIQPASKRLAAGHAANLPETILEAFGGAITSPPSDDGNTPSDEPPQRPPTRKAG